MKSMLLFKRIFLLVISSFFISNVLSQTCPADIISYWKFEEVGDTALTDYISGHTATSSVPITNDANGKVGNAKYFDGTKYVVVQDHPDYGFGIGSSFSVEFWVKYDDASYGTSNKVIMGQRDLSGAYWFVGVEYSTGKIVFELQDSDGVYREIKTPGAYSNGIWHHVVAVRNGSTNTNNLYVDGSLQATTTYAYTGGFDCNANITMGCWSSSIGIPDYFFKGSIDEVAMYSRALPSTDVSAHKLLGDNGIGYCDSYSPSFISIPNVKAAVGTPYTYTAHATGLQANMNYSLITRPTGMVIDANTGVISWTPSSITQDGTVRIVAENGVPPADTQTFRIFIAAAPDCPANLSVLLKLDESSGPLYSDFYVDHNATALVSPSAATGIVNGAQLFNATTKIDIPDLGEEFEWTQNDDFSIEFWIRTPNTNTMVCVGRHRQAGDYDTLANWWVGLNASGVATFSLQDNHQPASISYEISGGPPLSDNGWHHIVAVREGSTQTNRLIVDGIEEQTVSTDYTNSFRADIPTPINVGYWKRAHGGENEYHFEGILDEVAIYDRALTEAEANSYFNNGNPTGHCAPGNYAPVITSDPVTTGTQDVLYTYNITFEDVDESDLVTITAPVKPDWLTLTSVPGQKTAVLSGTPLNDDVGPASVTLRVSDGKIDRDQVFVINVANVNDAPVITSTPATSVDEDVAYSYVLTITDADPSDVITMTAVTVPGWLTFSWVSGAKTATLEGTPTNDDTGNNQIDISITDGTETIHDSYLLVVNPINDPPVISDQRSLTIDEDESITLQLSDLTVEDVDNNAGDLTLSVQAGNDFSFVGNVVTPDENFNGQLTVPVVVSDLEDESQTFNVTITVNPVNDAPVITSVPDETVEHGLLYAYAFVATDVDGDVVTYSATTLPDWLQFSASNGILTGTPAYGNIGQHLVVLSASDGTVSVDQIFTITVGTNAVNENESRQFKLYPVPVREMLNIEFSFTSDDSEVSIYNSTGVLVKSVSVSRNTELVQIEVSDLDAGAYFCKVRNHETVRTVKFLKSE